jgi:hypothetical protein
VAGTTVRIACGEALQAQRAAYTWGWEFTWTLREGEQLLEQAHPKARPSPLL